MKPAHRRLGRSATAATFATLLALSCGTTSSHAQADRLRIWDLQLGTSVAEMPPWIAFKDYACGSNGGPPLRPLAGWQEYNLCEPDESGLYEVYFEYDDEAEYILRALNDQRVAQYVGTTDSGFPIVASALFDGGGVLRGVRLVTDPRADYANDAFFELAALRTRGDHFLLGPFVGAHFGINPDIDCVNRPLAANESPVGTSAIKLDCEKVDAEAGFRYRIQTRFLRKPGQLARDPNTNLPTVGQFESITRAEMFQIGYGPAESLTANPPLP